MTTANLVRTVLRLTFPPVWDAAHALWTAPDLRERYPTYLGAMLWLVRASVPLMEVAVDSCDDLPPGDPSAEPLAAYFQAHIAEEQGHDDWLIEDLAALGVREPDAPREDIAALAGAQYYLIRHYHPACLLGYIAVLEGCPPNADVVDRLPARTGLPAPAFRTLAEHAAVDPGHQQDLDRLLDALSLTSTVGAAVARNAAYTADRAAELLRSLAPESVGP